MAGDKDNLENLRAAQKAMPSAATMLRVQTHAVAASFKALGLNELLRPDHIDAEAVLAAADEMSAGE